MRRLLPLVLAASAGCAHCPPIEVQPISLRGRQLTSAGSAREPRIAWNGKHFGIVYLQLSGNAVAQVHGLLVDKGGNVLQAHQYPAPVEFGALGYEPFRLSDLVWNARDGQFAFGYAHRVNSAWLARADSSLRILGFTRIHFPGFPPAQDPPTPVDVSLAWNDTRLEYGLAYVTREEPQLPRHDDIYLARVAADGSLRNPGGDVPGGGWHTVNCPTDCRRTSIGVDPRTGRYAIAYLELAQGQARPRLGLVDESLGFGSQGAVHAHDVLEALPAGAASAAGIRLFFDAPSGDWLVGLANADPGGALRTQVVALAAGWGVAPGAMQRTAGDFERLFTLSNFMGGAHAYEVCFGDGQVRCRLATDTSLATGDWVTPPAGAPPRGDASHALADDGAAYLVWIEGGNVHFGPAP